MDVAKLPVLWPGCPSRTPPKTGDFTATSSARLASRSGCPPASCATAKQTKQTKQRHDLITPQIPRRKTMYRSHDRYGCPPRSRPLAAASCTPYCRTTVSMPCLGQKISPNDVASSNAACHPATPAPLPEASFPLPGIKVGTPAVAVIGGGGGATSMVDKSFSNRRVWAWEATEETSKRVPGALHQSSAVCHPSLRVHFFWSQPFSASAKEFLGFVPKTRQSKLYLFLSQTRTREQRR